MPPCLEITAALLGANTSVHSLHPDTPSSVKPSLTPTSLPLVPIVFGSSLLLSLSYCGEDVLLLTCLSKTLLVSSFKAQAT